MPDGSPTLIVIVRHYWRLPQLGTGSPAAGAIALALPALLLLCTLSEQGAVPLLCNRHRAAVTGSLLGFRPCWAVLTQTGSMCYDTAALRRHLVC